jgi:hypothetical protein
MSVIGWLPQQFTGVDTAENGFFFVGHWDPNTTHTIIGIFIGPDSERCGTFMARSPATSGRKMLCYHFYMQIGKFIVHCAKDSVLIDLGDDSKASKIFRTVTNRSPGSVQMKFEDIDSK